MCDFEATLYLRALKNIRSAFNIYFATSAKFGGRHVTLPPLDLETLQVVKFGCLKCFERDLRLHLNGNV